MIILRNAGIILFTKQKVFQLLDQLRMFACLKYTRSTYALFSHCAIVGTSFVCDGGGRGGGQFGALTPGFFGGGFLRLCV